MKNATIITNIRAGQPDWLKQLLIGTGAGFAAAALLFGNAHAAETAANNKAASEAVTATAAVAERVAGALEDRNLEAQLAAMAAAANEATPARGHDRRAGLGDAAGRPVVDAGEGVVTAAR